MSLKHVSALLLASLLAFSAAANDSSKRITARLIDTDIVLDGDMSEAAWQGAEIGREFQQFFPSDDVLESYPTTFKMLYSDSHIYIGIYAEKAPGDVVISSLKRELGARTNDNISFLFDTFSNGDTAYFFGVTPYGVRREGLASKGGTVFNNAWDVKWDAEANIYDDHFVIEVAIPFTSLKYPKANDTWRFRPYRWDNQSNEQTTWVKVPQNQLLSNLAYMGELVFEKPLKEPSKTISIIPYANAMAAKNYVAGENSSDFKLGADAKIAITDGLNLDVTVNPDFSTVEADDVLTNLSRFELRREEKRQFFIENSDLFESWGNIYNDSRPFFSRRIGLANDANGNLVENDILGGVRLSGNVNPDWRIGFLDIQTDRDDDNQIAGFNNMMLALQRRVGERSSMGAFVVDRRVIDGEHMLSENEKSNSVMGVDYNLQSADSLWTGKLFYHRSTQADGPSDSSAQATVTYNSNTWEVTQDLAFVGDDFRADIGWVPRKDMLKWGNGIRYNFYPESDTIRSHEVGLLTVNWWKPSEDNQKTDHIYRLSWNTTFNDQAKLETYIGNNYVRLSRSFDPTRNGATPLAAGDEFEYNQLYAKYSSSLSNRFTYNVSSTVGEFYNGHIRSLGGEVGYRFQPWGEVSFRADYNRIELPAPYGSADLMLASAKAEIAFSRKLFWNTLIQYSNQGKSLGINSRLQWRFAPLSDVYLVYNDSYDTDGFTPRFRSINLKVNYWYDY